MDFWFILKIFLKFRNHHHHHHHHNRHRHRTHHHHHHRRQKKYILKDSDKFHFKFLLPYVSFNNVFKESLSFVFLSLKQILTTPIVKFVLQKTLDETSSQLK